MASETTHIREANIADVSILSTIIRHAFRDVAERFSLTSENCPKHPSYCTDGWISKDFSRGVIYYVLEHKETPQGCVALEKAGSDLCYLERLAVLPAERRKGYGKSLVEHVFMEARALEVTQMSIGIISDDIPLKMWYKKLGFIEKETKSFPHLPFRVAFLFYEL
jgi:N-acetylglutamate synthase-like GNAT family acetyltransferase